MHTSYLLFLAAAFVLAITPGPGIFYVAARTLAGGRGEGFASVAGNSLGGMVHVFAGAIGVSALIMASAHAFTVLKFAGAIYLIWLGIKTFRDARDAAPLEESATGVRKAFVDGIAVEAFNPKTAAFFLAFIPQFLDPAHGIALQFIVLGTISVLLNSAVDALVVLSAARARNSLTARPHIVRRLRQSSGLAMCGLGVGLALAKR
jgi:threonine/homoserine/homoserine lactone efflux protein